MIIQTLSLHNLKSSLYLTLETQQLIKIKQIFNLYQKILGNLD